MSRGFGIFFSIVAVMGLLSIVGEIVMRVRLTRRTSRDKIAWWRRGGDEVAASYEDVFPDSRLPFLRRFAFWLFVALCVLTFLMLLWKRY
jgi:hypothetical protein